VKTAYCVVVSWADDSDVQAIGPFFDDSEPSAFDIVARINSEDPDFERYARVEPMYTVEEWFGD
jgi:hypothetical protein